MNILPAFDSVDLYIGELARRGKRPATRIKYRRDLTAFIDRAGVRYVHEITLRHYQQDVDRWTDASPSTLAVHVSMRKGYSTFLFDQGYTEMDVAAPLKRPRRPRYEDLDVTTIEIADVIAMLDACADWQEFLCIATAFYLGNRRAALAAIRRGHVDLVNGTVRIAQEKGGKIQVKPLPDEYLQILASAERNSLWQSGDDYLIPNRRPASVKRKERSDKIVWETVKRVAARAGVAAHVHAFRAAFAVAFHEAHPEQAVTLKDLLGHASLETQLIYLRRRNKARGMEAVRDLSLGGGPRGVFSSQAIKAHTGFEPVFPSDALVFDIRQKLGALTATGVTRAKERV